MGGQRAAELAELVRDAGAVVALTGAGISVPSGIPDFRTPVTGLWANVDPMQVAHIDVFREQPQVFWRFYGERFATLGDRQPNGAHLALVAMERAGLLDGVITQNVDMLHTRAGSTAPVEVHGSIAGCRCPRCGAAVDLQSARALLAESPDSVPRCPGCGDVLKPEVVLFGEALPRAALERAVELSRGADLMLCIGSSLEVHPVAALPRLTLEAGGRVAIVTAGATPYDREAALRLEGDVEQEMLALAAALALDVPAPVF
ncbi:MAG TPA: Sir2 family NAD-dependent protein deacetylase [Solirubrobacteraceae bacterium]|nr:Sir2 family NAD-dependent protein deacetylase [Solirubrobacteraceae bacterium]